jgi:hypothetical protein
MLRLSVDWVYVSNDLSPAVRSDELGTIRLVQNTGK